MTQLFVLWVVVIIAIVVSIVLSLPALSTGDKGSFGLILAMFLAQIGAIYYFLSSLKTFRKNLRFAYYLLSTGIFLFGIAELQLPIVILFSIDSPLLGIGVVVSYVAASFFVYLGVRKFAALLSISSVFISVPIALGLNLLSAASGFLLAKFLTGDITNAINTAIFAIGAIFFMMSAIIMLPLRSALSAIYTQYHNPVRWLAMALITFSFATFHELIVKLVLLPDNWYIYYGVSLWPYVLGGLLFLWTGILFKKTGDVLVNFDQCKNYVDIVVTLARLASYQKDIDSDLDVLREITAIRAPEELNESDKTRLVRLFAKIEQYLIYSDPLRKFTQEDIRVNLPTNFKSDLEKLG